MNALLGLHIAGGVVALFAGTGAVAARKGGMLHARLGTGFCVAMLVLGATAAILLPFKTPAESPVGGLMVCYFVATAWRTAHLRGVASRADVVAGLAILAIGALVVGSGLQAALDPGSRPGPPGPVGLFILGTLCLFAGAGDLAYARRGTTAPVPRRRRHLWRMCFAFFMATSSFFLGQQDMLPAMVRGSGWLLLPAFAPFLAMVYWLVRVKHPVRGARPAV